MREDQVARFDSLVAWKAFFEIYLGAKFARITRMPSRSDQ
jgi:hypothetical protein